MSQDLENRDIRQKELVHLEKMQDKEVIVIGVGAVGKQVAMQLAAIGVPNLKLIDFDDVGVENLASQGFFESDIGRPKIDAVSDVCKKINSQINIQTENRKFNKRMFNSGFVFCCVDKIDVRKNIFESISGYDLFIDARMAAESARILCVYNSQSAEYYKGQFFAPEEAYAGRCTAQTTIYCANIIAGFMVAQFAKFLRGCDLDNEIELNLLTNSLIGR